MWSSYLDIVRQGTKYIKAACMHYVGFMQALCRLYVCKNFVINLCLKVFQAILCRHVGILVIFYSEIDHRVSFFEGISNPLMIQSLEKVRRNEVLIAAVIQMLCKEIYLFIQKLTTVSTKRAIPSEQKTLKIIAEDDYIY